MGMTASTALCFLHLFSGARDKLGEALLREAKASGIELTIETFAKEMTSRTRASCERSWERPRLPMHYLYQIALASGGWTARPGAFEIAHLQDEADKGTLFAITSVEILAAVDASQAVDGKQRPVTLENPPESNHPEAGLAYYLSEVVQWLSRARSGSSTPNLCKCGRRTDHPKVVGTKAAKDSASCRALHQLRQARRGGLAEGGTLGRRPRSLRQPPSSEFEEGQAGDATSSTALWPACPEGGGALRHGGLQDHGRGGMESMTELEAQFGVCSQRPELTLKSLLHYDTPVNVALLEAWTQLAKDPDQAVIEWLKYGAPLGANMGIPSVGIFPPKEEDAEAWEEAKAEAQVWEAKQNYSSFTANPTESTEEMERLMDLGYVRKITEEQAANYFSGGVVSKLGLLMKPKADGTVKRRIIVDALRSGANQRARCPERIVLPRPQDVYTMAADLKALEPQLLEWYRAKGEPTTEWGSELVAADLTDAFTHFPVHPSEHEQCLSPTGDGKLLQGMFWQAELQLATYIDDPLTALVGSRHRRLRNLSLVLLTLGALGIRLAWHKGARGCRITWIGVNFTLRWREGVLDNEVPDKLRDELLEKLGKWAAGIYKRARWAVSMVYGAITAHEADVRSGAEATRRAARRDSRPKDHLVPVKRFELARAWLEKLLKERRPRPTMSLWKRPESIMIVTDASPQGCGGLLLGRATTQSPWSPLKAYEYRVEPKDAELLGILGSLGNLSCAPRMGGTVGIHSGGAGHSLSTVALALLEKAASSSAALNLLAAEMALLLEKLQVGEVALSHVPGKLNVLADWLARPDTRGVMPSQLQGVKIANPSKLQGSDFSLGFARSHDAAEAGASWAALKG
ncbi:unnamed protein product [Symbiodinium sp. CCMP2592]|nr:unnamed protein product [Symbiodinium sp. CCMP2592]